jgi:hypothetical protein
MTEIEMIGLLAKRQKEMSEEFLKVIGLQVDNDKSMMDRILELGNQQLKLLVYIKDLYSRMGLKIQQEKKPDVFN